MTTFRRLVVPAVMVAAVGLASAPSGATSQERSVVAGLAGPREVPNPGDRNGSGFARISIDVAAGTICYSLTVRNIAPATAAHIHAGSRHVAGGVVLGLQAPTDGTSSGCVVDSAVASAVASDPDGYYVNVHNAEFPAGAVRGQLAGARS